MRRIGLSYDFAAAPAAGDARIGNRLMALLHAVREEGSISGAARRLGLSYRYVWGELREWEADLGHELIVWEKGQPARLTPFGDKLLWAEQQSLARLAPQIEALRAELERTFAVAFDEGAQVLTIFASHDEAVGMLREHAAGERLHLDVRFCGSVDAITALNQGRCTVAGFHAPPHPAAGSLTQRTYQPLLQPGRHKLIGFARRRQGLVVARGNPLGLRSLGDVAASGARYVNRGIGSGTRLLFEELREAAGLGPADVRDGGSAEPSHAAVAQAVASGAADAGLAIEPAAAARGLGFVPLVQEDYYLACLKEALDDPAVQTLVALLASREWHGRLEELAGYSTMRTGEVLSLTAQLPWWRFEAPKRA